MADELNNVITDSTGAVTTLNLRIHNKYDSKANWETNNPILLAGEIGIESDTNKFKFGDGINQWNSINYASVSYDDFKEQIKTDVQTQVFMAEITDELTTDEAVLENANVSAKAGDIFIVTKTVAGKPTQSPYVYYDNLDTTGWYAIAGTFDATRVLIGHDITLAGSYTTVGNVKLSDGKITNPGTLDDLITKIFTQELNPSITGNPSVSLTLRKDSTSGNSVGGTSYEAGTKLTVAYTCSLNTGSYTYKSSVSNVAGEIIPVSGTGITAKSWAASDTDSNSDVSELTTTSGVIGEVQVLDTGYSFTMTASYDAGNYALTNLNNLPTTEVRIPAGSKAATAKISGYRNMFYGYMDATTALTSDNIRKLKSSQSGAKNLSLDEDTSAARIILALPSGRSLSAAIMPSSSNADVLGEFKEQSTKVSVAGANGYSPQNYTIYVYQPSKMGGTYQLTIK